MKIIEVNNRSDELIKNLLEIWEDSVKATHLFLSQKDIEKINEYVPQAISEISILVIALNNKKIVGFMGVDRQTLEMLFILNEYRGKGIGKNLLLHGIKKYSINNLTVNEQNLLAKGFYEHMGFRVYKRTQVDEQNDPYPLLYMKLKEENTMIENFISDIKKFSLNIPSIESVIVVGSYARGDNDENSDLDLVIITSNKSEMIKDQSFIQEFGEVLKSQTEYYGACTSISAWYKCGLEVEFGIVEPSWIQKPLDIGTRDVLSGGYKIIVDKKGRFENIKL